MFHKLSGKYYKLSKIKNIEFYERKFMILKRDCPYILSFDYDNKKMINLTSFNTIFYVSYDIFGSSLEDEKIKIYYSNSEVCKNEINLINQKIKLYQKIKDEEIINFEKQIT